MFDGFNLQNIFLQQGFKELSPEILNITNHSFDEYTGELFKQSRLGIIKGLRFDENINPHFKKISLRGSFIREKNNGEHTLLPASFDDIQNTLHWLDAEGIDLLQTKISSIEFGALIELDRSANDFLNGGIYSFQNPFNKKRYDYGGYEVDFEFYNYRDKFYNKSAQYKLKDKHILRIERKTKRMRYFEDNRINSISNLLDLSNPNLYQQLFKNLQNILSDKIFLLPEARKKLSLYQKNELLKFTNTIFGKQLQYSRKEEEQNKNAIASLKADLQCHGLLNDTFQIEKSFINSIKELATPSENGLELSRKLLLKYSK